MASTTTVRAHSRRKPEKPVDPLQPEISRRLSEIRAKAEADAKVNDFRESEDWKRGPNALVLIAVKLKVLAARLVQ